MVVVTQLLERAISFDSLLGHCDTLVELDLRTEMAISPVVLALMHHGSHLEALSVGEMYIAMFLRSLSWACTGLKATADVLWRPITCRARICCGREFADFPNVVQVAEARTSERASSQCHFA